MRKWTCWLPAIAMLGLVGCGPIDEASEAFYSGKGDNGDNGGPEQHTYLERMSDAELQAVLSAGVVQQREQLALRLAELQRWAPADRALFGEWFGTEQQEARQIVIDRLQQILAFNEDLQAGARPLLSFFGKGPGCEPRYYAYVHPDDPPTIYLCQTFVFIEIHWQPAEGTRLEMPRDLLGQGEYSASHVLTHEMSHFTGTGDYGYGVKQCTTLANLKRRRTAANADTIAFYVDGSLPPLVPKHTFDDYAATVIAWSKW